jgi:hypothetical protein
VAHDPRTLINIYAGNPETYRYLNTNQRNKLVVFLHGKYEKQLLNAQPRSKKPKGRNELANLMMLMELKAKPVPKKTT